jgi:low affinity Fe/Cu permease
MARYGTGAQKSVKRAMHKRKKGTLTSGKSSKRVKNRKQAIAIGLSEARRKGAKVPRKAALPSGLASVLQWPSWSPIKGWPLLLSTSSFLLSHHRDIHAQTGGLMRKPQTTLTDAFHHFSKQLAAGVGSPWAFIAALGIVVVWSTTGPFFQYSDTWQLVINTSTTIVTFLMVFLIQNTQNRDAKAIHLKLDELIRSVKGARNTLIDLEELSEEELDDLQRQFVKLRRNR